MSFLGGKQPKNTTPIYTGIQLQTSTAAAPFIIAWGRNRFSTNILQYTDFKKHKQKQQGGKGGPKNKTYTYSATIILGLCEGTIQGVGTVWKDGDTQSSLSELGFTLFTGTYPQAPWGYMVAKHPDQAFSYKGVAYLAAANYDLGSSAAVPNHSFEVKALRDSSGYTAAHDADCALILHDFLFDVNYGLLVPAVAVDVDQMLSTVNATTIGDDSYQTYCRAMGFGMSPVLSTQEAASSIVQRWCQLTNTAAVWTGYTLKFIPYCYAEVDGNGVKFKPNLTPVYTLSDDDYVSNNDDPLEFSRIDPSAAKNAVRFIIKDPSNQYNDLPVPYQDQALIDQYGLLQDSDFTAAELTDVTMASTVCALYGKRNAYQRNTYTCVLGPAHCLLEAMDIVQAYDPKLGLIKLQVTATKESDDGTISVTMEPFSVAVSSVNPADIQPTDGYQINTGQPAGPVNPPVILEPPANLSGGVAQVWAALSGGDGTTENVYWGGCTVYISADGGTNYQAVGTQDTNARQGKLTAALATYAGANPDTAHTLSVDLAMSAGDLQSVSAGDASSGTTLCYVDGEYLSFETATLTTTYGYDITNLWRGLYGTTPSAHASGAQFARLDENVFTYNLPVEYIGVPLKFKFQSYNVWNSGVEDLADCVVYDYTPVGTGYSIAAPTSCTLSFAAHTQTDGTSIITGTVVVGPSAGPFLDHYDVQYTSDGGTTWTDTPSISAGSTTTSFGPALATTNYQARTRAVSSAVGGIPSAWVTSAVVDSGALVSAPPDPATGLTATGATLANNLAWTAPAAGTHVGGYSIYAINSATGAFGSATQVGQTTSTSWTHAGLGVSDTWRYWVVAFNAAGDSTPDGPENATTRASGGGGGGGSVEIDNPSGTTKVATASKISFSTAFDVTVGAAGEAIVDIEGTDVLSWVVDAVGTGASQAITSANFAGLSKFDVLVTVNGLAWLTTDYSISGTTLTLTTNSAGDAIEIRGPITIGSGWAVDATGTTGGSPQVISSPEFAGLNPANLLVIINGLVSPVSEYSVSGSDLTVTPNTTGDLIEVRGPLVNTVVGGGGGGGGGGGSTAAFVQVAYGRGNGAATATLAAAATAGNLIVAVSTGANQYKNIDNSMSIINITSALANQWTMVWTKIAAGGETAFTTNGTDNQNLAVYEFSTPTDAEVVQSGIATPDGSFNVFGTLTGPGFMIFAFEHDNSVDWTGDAIGGSDLVSQQYFPGTPNNHKGWFGLYKFTTLRNIVVGNGDGAQVMTAAVRVT